MSSIIYTKNTLKALTVELEQLGERYRPERLVEASYIIDNCFTAETIYPFMSFSGPNELIFQWVAGERSIQVSLDDGSFYVHVTNCGRKVFESYGDWFSAFPYEELAEELKIYTAHVNMKNLTWRTLYPAL